jgi:hypothetical protein
LNLQNTKIFSKPFANSATFFPALAFATQNDCLQKSIHQEALNLDKSPH